MKKIIVILMTLSCLLTGCAKEQKNIEGTLPEIMEKLYTNISEEEMPMFTENIEITKETIENFVGTNDFEFESALASESMVGSTAHSIVLIRVKENENYEEIVNKIKEKANPRKWICVEAENVIVKNKGNLIILIMTNDLAPKIEENFNNLE